MKKVLLSIVFLISLALVSQAVNPVHVQTQSIESVNLGANNDTVPEFTLGHINFIADNSGSTEYKNGWIRNNTEWCLYRSYNDGSLLVQAEEGYWIRDVTFTYAEKSDGMLSDHAGESQSKIAAYASNKAIAINGASKQFYVGKTKTGDGGYLTILKFAVSYYKSPDSLALEDQKVAVGDAFQLALQVFPTDADTIFTWSSDNENIVVVDGNGVINAKAAGEATITVTTGRVSASCQVTIVEDASQTVEETFSHCTIENNYSGTTAVAGDDSLYQWNISHYQRQLANQEDKVGGKQGIRVRYSGAIAMDGTQEGGIKAVAFDWRTANSVNRVNYNVQVGEQYYEYNSEALSNTTVYHFARQFEVKENTSFSVNMEDKMGTDGQSYVIVGPITITPYLLFNLPNHRDRITIGTSGEYNLKNVLINNTNEEPVFTILSNTTGATTSIEDGVLTISNKTQEGEIVIQAAWNEGLVTTTMTLCVDKTIEPMEGERWTETFSNCTTTSLLDGRVHVIGDQGIYDWSVSRFQRTSENDRVGDQQGIRLRYNGAIASSGAQEGGVKELAFDWRAADDKPVHFTVWVGEKAYDYSSPAVSTTDVMHYICQCMVAQNVSMKVAIAAEESPAQSYVVVGSLSILPYLLFVAPDHRDTLRMAEATSYDLYEMLIDNTDSVGEITYAILNDATGAATLEGSIIHMGEVEVSGAVEVQASWQNVTTTMTLWVEANDPLGIDNTHYPLPSTHYTKIMHDGHIRIYRGSDCYTILGQTIY